MIRNNKTLASLLFLCLITLIVYRITPYDSGTVEFWYSRKFFSFYRIVWDNSISLLPVNLVYILILFILIYLVQSFTRSDNWFSGLRTFLFRIVVLMLCGIITFYWLWGFNYKRPGLGKLLELSPDQPDVSFVANEYCRIQDSLVVLKQQILDQNLEFNSYDQNNIRRQLEDTFEQMVLPASGRVKVARLKPKGSLLHISTAGVYLPFVGQGHIDMGLHPITHPFTMMHEMAHGYGYTGEDECNFLALIGCITSTSEIIRYSGYFGYWRYLRAQLLRIDKQTFEEYYREIPKEISGDYREILEYQNRYPDILPKFRDFFYDTYLKSHGISDGLINYSQMIVLYYQWQMQNGRF